MKKKLLLSATILALSIIASNILGFSWGDIGDAFKKAGNTIADTAKDAGNKINDNVIKPIDDNVIKPLTAGWEMKRKVGRQLDDGAKQLEDSPGLLQDSAVSGLQTGLIDGINNTLMKTLINNAGDIADKRAEIAKNKKMIKDNQDLANQLGKASLAQDLIDGFTAADEALSMLWAGPNIKKQLQPAVPTTAAPKTAFGALRQKLITTAQSTANVDIGDRNKMIQDDKNDGVIWQLLNAGQTVINDSQAGINTIRDQIQQLKDKINTSPVSLPTRMRGLAKILKV